MSEEKQRGLIPRVNFFDGQRVTEVDLDDEQSYNRSVSSNVVLDFHGSGVINESPFGTNILLDTRTPGLYSGSGSNNPSKEVIESGSYDGRNIQLDIQPSDTERGCRLELELIDSDAYGRREVRVLILGRAFDGIGKDGELVCEYISFKDNLKKITSKYYTSVVGVLFNNFSGGTGKTELNSSAESLDLISHNAGGMVIREVPPLMVYPKSPIASQIDSPNIYLNNFITSSIDNSIEYEIKEAFGSSISFNDLYFELDSKEQIKFEKDGDTTIEYGQKFLATSNNIQRVDLLLSVESDEDADLGSEFDFSGDIVVSIHKLSTDTSCPTDVVPDNFIDFDPEFSPEVEMAFGQDDLEALGYKLTDVPQIVSFNFSGTLIADPNIEPSIEKNKYYAVMVSRRGDNRVGTVVMEKAYDKPLRKADNGQEATTLERFEPQHSRFVEFDPATKRYIDDVESSLWFIIHSDTVEVTSGSAYSDDGFSITIPKTEDFVGGTEISLFLDSISLADVGEGEENFVVLAGSNKFVDPDVHPRTGNFVFSRVLDYPAISVKTSSEISDLSYPILLANVVDTNVRDAQDITGEVSHPGLITHNRAYFINPSSELLNSNLVDRIITPDIDCQCASKYRIARVKCHDLMAGDFDDDGEITNSDILSLINLVGHTINSSVTEDAFISGEISVLDFYRADLNSDETIDGFDISLIEDAVDGYVNFTTSEKFRVLELTLENILEEDDFREIISTDDLSGQTTSTTNTLTFTSPDERYSRIIMVGDILTIEPSLDEGTYLIQSKEVSEDGVTVTLEVSDLDGGDVYFAGSTSFDVSITSGSAVNTYADNINLATVPYNKTEFSISYIDAPFQERFVSSCDLRRFVESSFIEEGGVDPCDCSDDDCDEPDPCLPEYKNQYVIPNDLYIPNGEIYSEPGIPYHGDIEYANIIMPLPPGSMQDCAINLYETFVKSDDGDCKTSAGYPAMKYSDGTYVGCEDNGDDNDIYKGRVKFSRAIASLYVDSLVDGYTTDAEEYDTSTAYASEKIYESFKEYSYETFSSWSVDAISSSITSITNASGPNQPAIFELTTISDASERVGRLNSPTEARSFEGDFIVDFTAYRSVWPESSLTSGEVFSGGVFSVSNDDGSSATLYLGWKQNGSDGIQINYRGEIYDSLGVLESTFDYYTDSDDSIGDTVLFRLRRTNDVITAMYMIPGKLDLTTNPTQQYIRVGENPERHPGMGSVSFDFDISQKNSPVVGLAFATKLINISFESEYDSNEVSEGDTIVIGRSSSTNDTSRLAINFPLNFTDKTQITSAKIILTAASSFDVTDSYNVLPIDVIDADNLSLLYNYPLGNESSYMASFTPNTVIAGEQISVDITTAVLGFLAVTGHLPGYMKAFVIEASDSADSSISFESEITIVIDYLDLTTGVIFQVGMNLDSATGIATFNTRNILYDAMILENRTTINFGVYLKKSGFINSDVSVSINDLDRIGIGSCTDENLLEEEECYFIAGSTATGTFVQGPFPCTFHMPPMSISPITAEQAKEQLEH